VEIVLLLDKTKQGHTNARYCTAMALISILDDIHGIWHIWY